MTDQTRACPFKCGRACHAKQFCCKECNRTLTKEQRDVRFRLHKLFQTNQITVEEMHRRQEAAILPTPLEE